MPQVSHTYNYSAEHMFGWLSAQMAALPSYDALLKVADSDVLEHRCQALQKWRVFESVTDWSPGWTTKLLEEKYDLLYESLPSRGGIAISSYLRDYLWIQRSMPYFRQLARRSFLEKRVDFATDQDFLVYMLTAMSAQVDLPDTIEATFLLTFTDALHAELTLTTLEAALDKAVLLMQINHFASTKSVGIKQWIVLITILEWTKMCTRSANLGLTQPEWSDWFPADLLPKQFANFAQVRSLITSYLTNGTEWVVSADILAEHKFSELDPVEVENQAKMTLSRFLNQSIFQDDMQLYFLRHAYHLRMIIETAGVITARSIPHKEQVLVVTANYDA